MNDDYDIAIVGMSCRLPGARNLDEFWNNLIGGVHSISRLSDEEILSSGVPTSYLSDPAYVRAAPILDDPGDFDSAFFDLSPMEAKTMDPQHRILLELAYEALEHAGCDPDRHQRPIGVFTGAAMNTYFMNVGLNSRFPTEYIPTLIGNDKDFLSTRISYKLNLKGPSITVQTACSTSMVAVHLARQSLLSGETDMALAGGVSVRVPHHAGYFCDGGGIVSADGHVRAFDVKANGTVFGSGGGMLVLKRLADARLDGDSIYALIKGSAVNNDGSEKAGYTAPSVNSQADVVVEALANAGVDADSISYVEAHGSGTPVGDPIEIRALTKAFHTFTKRKGYCGIGSVKTNVGHLDAAAAVTGIIKTVLSLKHRQVPPSLHYTEANPEIDFPNSPFYVNTELREWTSVGPRRAGVMSTGMGGTNAHIILEEAPELPVKRNDSRTHLLLLSAKSETALNIATERLAESLARDETVNLSDVAYTLQTGRKGFPYRRFLVCTDVEDAVKALRQVDSKLPCRKVDDSRRSVIFLLPGIGDQYLGMGYDLYETHPIFRQEVDRCAELLSSDIGVDIRKIIYPESKSWKQDSATKGIDLRKMLGRKTDELENQDSRNLNQTHFAHPALFTIEYAMARLWQSLGIQPDAIIGHSMGEYVAACLAGVFSLNDALHLIATRAKLVSGLPKGTLLAVMLPENKIRPLLPEDLSISLINGPELCVVAGPIEMMAGFENKLNEEGILYRHVQNGHAFHSSMLDPIVETFEKEVSKVQLNEPKIPYISNVTGNWVTANEATSPGYWAQHATQTARFSNALENLWQLDDPILLEAGPGRTLIALALQHPARSNPKPLTISSLRHHYERRPDVEFLWQNLGTLWTTGIEIKWENLHPGERRNRIALPTYPFERQRYWLEPLSIPDTAAKAQESIMKKDLAEWLYVQSWKRLVPSSARIHDLSSKRDKKWLFFSDDAGLPSILINKLRSAGHEVVIVRRGSIFQQVDRHSFTIEPSNSQHFDRLIHALHGKSTTFDHIVFAWGLTEQCMGQPKAVDFERAQTLGFYSLIFLARALAANDAGHQIKLFVVSNHIQDVIGNEVLEPERSTLLGPCIVIRQEYPNIVTKNIDLDISDRGAYESAAECLLGEFFDSDSNLFIAYRNAQRWVQTYEPLQLSQETQCSPFRQGGVYLITGGLGAVGTTISEYLARNYHAKLVVVGRTSLPGKESWNAFTRPAERSYGIQGDGLPARPGLRDQYPDGLTHDPLKEKFRALERIELLGGEVLYISANVADLNGMRNVVHQAYQRFGALHGVFHGAGIVGDYLEIKDTSFEKCDPHFKAKAQGLMVLEEVLDGKPLDFCLLVSSLASVLGGLGQAAYASANIYMDAFARRHNRWSSFPWLSVNWDVWRGRDDTESSSSPGSTLKGLGMNPSEAMSMMDSVLALKRAGHLVVSTGDLGARIDQWIKLESLRFGPAAPSVRQSTVFEGDKTEQRIARIWQETLGVAEIGIHDNFAQLGGHSLLAIRIVSELRRAFQIDLPIRALFDAPTVAELASYIKKLITAEIDALTEEEAEHLLQMFDDSAQSDDLVAGPHR